MYVTELDSFVKKFHQILIEGLTAHLDLDTHAGNAWVGLRVQLGHVPGHLHQQPVQPSINKFIRRLKVLHVKGAVLGVQLNTKNKQMLEK